MGKLTAGCEDQILHFAEQQINKREQHLLRKLKSQHDPGVRNRLGSRQHKWIIIVIVICYLYPFISHPMIEVQR